MERPLIGFLALGTLFISPLLSAASLTINIDGIRNSNGNIWIILHDNARAFGKQKNDQAAVFIKLPANSGHLSKTVNISPGIYAGHVIHDENANEKYDKKGLNPLEGYGYTNNLGYYAIPSFREASVKIGENDVSNTLTLTYY